MKIFQKTLTFIYIIIHSALLTNAQDQNPVEADETQNVPADGRVSGRIIDMKTNSPVEFASVVLIYKSTNQTVKETQTDMQGNFKIENVPYGLYTLKASFIGYQS